MINIIKVTGNSLSPFFLPGDYVITVKASWVLNNLKVGNVIVFNHLDYGVLVKIITSIDPVKQIVIVSGTHPDSIDSKTFGPVKFQEVSGKVIWHIKKPRI